MRASVTSLSKKLISTFFAATLALGLVPAAAFAVEDDAASAANDSLSLIPEGEQDAASIASSTEGGSDDVFSHYPSDDSSSVDGGSGNALSKDGNDINDNDVISTKEGGGETSVLAAMEQHINRDVTLETVVAQAESAKNYFLAQTLESTHTVPVVSAKLPIHMDVNAELSEGVEDSTSFKDEGGDKPAEPDLTGSPAISVDSTVVGAFEYLGMTFAVEPGGESVALIATDYSKLPETFIKKQVVVIPDGATADGVDYYGVTRIANGAFAFLKKDNANPDYTGCETLFSDEGLLLEAGIDPAYIQYRLNPADDMIDIDGDGEADTVVNPLKDCPGILALHVPSSITTIEDGAFADFETLQYIVVSDDNREYASYDGALYNADLSNLRFIPEGRVGAVCVAPSVAEIDHEAFSHCPFLDTLVTESDCEIKDLDGVRHTIRLLKIASCDETFSRDLIHHAVDALAERSLFSLSAPFSQESRERFSASDSSEKHLEMHIHGCFESDIWYVDGFDGCVAVGSARNPVAHCVTANGSLSYQPNYANILCDDYYNAVWYVSTTGGSDDWQELPKAPGNPSHSSLILPSDDLTVLYFKCSHVKEFLFDVTFDPMGGKVVYNNGYVYPENEAYIKHYVKRVGTLPSATRDGYQFGGWYTDADFATPVTASTAVASNMTVYARWIPDSTRTITFHWHRCTDQIHSTLRSSNRDGCLVTRTVTSGEYSGTYLALHGMGSNDNLFYWPQANGTLKVTSPYCPRSHAWQYATSRDASSNEWVTVPDFARETAHSSVVIPEGVTDVFLKCAGVSDFGYDVTFNSNAGRFTETGTAAPIVRHGVTTVGTLPKAEKSGYVLEGWYKDSALTDEVSAETPVTADIVLYAKWTPTYDVTFKANGGRFTSTNSTKDLVRGNVTAVGALPEVERTGWSFEGWYKDSALTEEVSAETPVTADTVLYAKWNPTYDKTLSWHVHSCSAHKEGQVTTTFDGCLHVWKRTEDGKTVTSVEEHSLSSSGSPMYWPGDGNVKCSNGHDWYVSTDRTEGWQKIPEVENFVHGSRAHAELNITDALLASDFAGTIYIRCSGSNDFNYDVTFKANGGRFTSTNSTKDLVRGNVTAVGALPEVERTGWSFEGWYKDSALTEEVSAETPVTADTVLYAKWNPTYDKTLNWHVHSCSAHKEGQVTTTFDGCLQVWKRTEDGKTVTSVEEHSLTGNGYPMYWPADGNVKCSNGHDWYVSTDRTEGWQKIPEVENFVTSSRAHAELNITDALLASDFAGTIYIRCSGSNDFNYDVTFKANGGRFASTNSTKDLVRGNVTAVGALPEVERTGFTLEGWFAADGTAVSSTTAVTDDMSIDARWAENTYNIAYDLNDGTQNVLITHNRLYSTADTMPSNATRRGWTLIGWSKTPYTDDVMASLTTLPECDWVPNSAKSVKDMAFTGLSSTNNATVKLYAVWKLNPYTLTLDHAGGGFTDLSSLRAALGATGSVNDAGTSISYTVRTNDFALPDSVKSGFTFSKWTDESGDPVQLVRPSDASFELGTRTFTAQWSTNAYSIELANEDASSVYPKPVFADPADAPEPGFDKVMGEEYSVTLKTPYRKGYEFKGWTGPGIVNGYQKNVTIYPNTLIGEVDANNQLVYTAHWTQKTYTVTYVLSDADDNYEGAFAASYAGFNGSVPQKQANATYTDTYRYDETGAASRLMLPNKTGTVHDAMRPGYELAGWMRTDDGSNVLVSSIDPTASAEHMTFKALWTPILSVTLPVTTPVDFIIDAATGRTQDAVAGTTKTLALISSTPVTTELSLACSPSDDAVVAELFDERESGAVTALINSLGFGYDLSGSPHVSGTKKNLVFARNAGSAGPLALAGSEDSASKGDAALTTLTVEGPFTLLQAKDASGASFEDLLIDLSKVHVKSEEERVQLGIDKVMLADIVWTVKLLATA